MSLGVGGVTKEPALLFAVALHAFNNVWGARSYRLSGVTDAVMSTRIKAELPIVRELLPEAFTSAISAVFFGAGFGQGPLGGRV